MNIVNILKPLIDSEQKINTACKQESIATEELTDDEEEKSLEKTTREIISNEDLRFLNKLSWCKVVDDKGRAKHRLRTLNTSASFFKDLETLRDRLSDKGFVNSLSTEKNYEHPSMTLRVTLRNGKM